MVEKPHLLHTSGGFSVIIMQDAAKNIPSMNVARSGAMEGTWRLLF
jgi:hypothetical protein